MTDSVGDCSISLRFITDFDHVTLDVLRTFKVICQRSRSRRGNVVWSSNYCFVLKILGIGVAESNGDDRILIGSSQLAVCTHGQ